MYEETWFRGGPTHDLSENYVSCHKLHILSDNKLLSISTPFTGKNPGVGRLIQ